MTTSNSTPAALAPTRTLGLTSFGLGLASILFSFTFLVPIAAIIVGFIARQREFAGRGFATWGIVLGFVMLFGWVIVLALGAAVFAPLALLHGRW